MKKRTVIILFLALSYLNSYEQNIDTLFRLFPPVQGIKEVNSLDTIKTPQIMLVFNRDSEKDISIQVFDKKEKLLNEGSYKEDSVYVLNTIFASKSGETTTRPRLLICNLYRHGYWTEYRRRREKRVYFDNGKKIKID